MKINHIQKGFEVREGKQRNDGSQQASTVRQDSIEISTAAQQLYSQGTKEREAKIEALKKLIEAQEYKPNPNDVAKKIARHYNM
ncbi:anti-sigma-28 factor FlgM family protein [Fictibacillus macauensis ZFHKF-1]|uniref:Anti-sigma-28 factor FlgM family protein n=1 Tax=Fictibacillus macauensis ZFHKF-1 TaxID=1196324 RepID=I8J3I1_9BACL|nr:flagellar biosynthesis anti-sigma factor FlgM [Fictibacillus macauensis]EIT86336.1 anti-sigma-28 factor FlgM family protein [Fictibacillus macauensis ZFHKF-1]